MPLSNEELLKQRYKVIAQYPEIEKHNLRLGDIITRSENPMYCDKTQDGNPVVAIDHEIFPANFKRLEWWDERNLYDKKVEQEVISLIPFLKAKGELHKGQVHKVKCFTAIMFGYMSGVRDAFESYDEDSYHTTIFELRYFEPATEQEYLTYTQIKK